MMHRLLNYITFLTIALPVCGQDYQVEFNRSLSEGDTAKQFEILQEWEKATPKDAELYTSYFNYYFLMSRQEVLELTTEPPKGESYSLQDSTGETAGYMGGKTFYQPNILNKGFEKIDEGIEYYPNRLDMRFGKIYVLGIIEDWERFTNEIVSTIQYSDKNNNAWTWANGETREDGKDFFLKSLQDYQIQLYNTGNDDLLVNMRTIAGEILKYYPEHIESLSNISITYLLTDEYDKAIETLLRAEEIDPSDAIVLNNIAQGYKLKGDIEMAITYYEKVIEHGDEDISSFARKQIDELKK